jgi:hypothetical protein
MDRAIQALELVRPIMKASPLFGNTFEGCVETATEICKIIKVHGAYEYICSVFIELVGHEFQPEGFKGTRRRRSTVRHHCNQERLHFTPGLRYFLGDGRERATRVRQLNPCFLYLPAYPRIL